LTNLTTLDLSGNQSTSFTLPVGLTSLTTLHLGGNQFTNFSFLNGLMSLTNLDIHGSSLNSLILPAGLTNLTTLMLYNSGVTSLTLPAGLTGLTLLDLRDNQLTNFSFLRGLTSLTILDLRGNQLTSLTLPAGLTSLSTLNLGVLVKFGDSYIYNYLTNLTLPAGLTSLTNLDVSLNPLSSFLLPESLAATNLAGTVASLRTNGVSVYTYPLGAGLSLSSPQRTTTGAFGFALAGPFATYAILSSTDLTAWNQVGTLTNALGAVVFSDPLVTNSVHKFYRARLAP
jgi:hypothetical protein